MRDGVVWRRGSAAGAVLVSAALAACGGGGGGHDGLPAFESAGGVVAADFDGDGRLDLAVAVAEIDGPPPHAGVVKVWLQRRDQPGAFTGPARYTVGPDPWHLVAADVDGDGRMDLAAMSAQAAADAQAPLVDSVVVLQGRGDGRFDTLAHLHAGVRLTGLAAADVDGDGRPDLVFSGVGAASGLWWNDRGAGGVLSPPVILDASVGSAVALGDLDADGRADPLVMVGDTLRWWAAQPGQARAFLPARTVASGPWPTCALAVDLDVDGRLDLVLCTRARMDVGAPGELRVWRQEAGGSFVASSTVPLPVHAWQCLAADTNGDGLPDLAAVGAAWGDLFDDMLAVVPGDRSRPGALLAPLLTATQDTASGYHLALGDLDGDGAVDIAVPTGGSLLLMWADSAELGGIRRGPLLPP